MCKNDFHTHFFISNKSRFSDKTCLLNNFKLTAKNTSEKPEVFNMLIVKNLCVAAKAVRVIKFLTVIKVIVAVFAFIMIAKNTLCAINE